MEALFHGVILAFGLILPLGAQNIFVFNQGATHRKFAHALPAVVTAGVCDTILIALAVAGVSVIVFQFEWLKALMFIAGVIFLTYMGHDVENTPEVNVNQSQQLFSARRQVAFAASVSLLNPHASWIRSA